MAAPVHDSDDSPISAFSFLKAQSGREGENETAPPSWDRRVGCRCRGERESGKAVV